MSLPGVTGTNQGIDPTKLRLAVFGILVFAAFVGLFSRLWYLQVLAKEDFRRLAKDNRVRFVYTEPERGRIFDANGKILVDNRRTLAATFSRKLSQDKARLPLVTERLAVLLCEDVKVKARRQIKPKRRKEMRAEKQARCERRRTTTIRESLRDVTVSPYKPIPVMNDVPESKAIYVKTHRELFPGVGFSLVPVRTYPRGALGSHILGFVNEIRPEQLKEPHFKNANVNPDYAPGDIVGQDGVEYTYDRFLRGAPGIRKIIVDAQGDVIRTEKIQDEQPGADLKLSLDPSTQRLTQAALENGLMAARTEFGAPSGAAVVLDPRDGAVLGMASYPTYDISITSDGFSEKEFRKLGYRTPNNPNDDALLNRAIQAQRSPGSTFKVITAAAAMATDVIASSTMLPCPASITYPPDAEPGAGEVFNNWTTADFGLVEVVRSLIISCNTYYYELGWQMEERWGAGNGDGQELFQKFANMMGLGHETGLDLPNEADGRIPDQKWCTEIWEATKDTEFPTCAPGGKWLPGYTVNMAIGQGDVVTTPLQMAVAYASIANGGRVLEPRFGWEISRSVNAQDKEVVKDYEPTVRAELPLDDTELGAIRDGLIGVTTSGEGTARDAFSGFPSDTFPIAGKTGTAQLGDTGENDAWFVSYGPAYDPRYVIAVYVENGGHGGETAAPISRQIWEGLANGDRDINIQLGEDSSG